MLKTETAWPKLTLDEWAPTQSTLHRWTQIVGKTRLALAPMQNHWWQVVLYVTDRGLTTSPIPYNGRTFDINFDFVDHKLVAQTSDGDERSIPLAPRSVADFYREYLAMLRSLDIEVHLFGRPVEIGDATPFAEDNAHASYEADAANRCWRILLNSDRVFRAFRGRFLGDGAVLLRLLLSRTIGIRRCTGAAGRRVLSQGHARVVPAVRGRSFVVRSGSGNT